MAGENIDDDLSLAIEPDDEVSKPVAIAIEGDKAEVVAADDAGKPTLDPIVAPEEGVESLKQQLAASRQRETALEDERKRLATEAGNARVEVVDSRYQMVLTALDKNKRDGDAAEAAYAKAMEEGNYAEAAKAQRLMARIEGNMSHIEGVKAQFEEAAKRGNPTTEGRVEPRQERPQAPQDPVEAYASGLTPKSGDWLRAHPEYVRDDALNADMIAAHKHALRSNIAADSPEYFAFVEKRLGIGHNDGGEPAVTVQPTVRVAAPSAPVSRDTPSVISGRQQRQIVTLTPAERDMARAMDMTDTEYAIEKVKIEAEKRSGALN